MVPVVICRISRTEYVTGFSFATNASQFGNNSNGNNAGLNMKSGIPRKFITPQKVSCDFDVAATITDIPENPSENAITMSIIGIIKTKLAK